MSGHKVRVFSLYLQAMTAKNNNGIILIIFIVQYLKLFFVVFPVDKAFYDRNHADDD